jgi:hypothetical protein
MGLIVYFLHSFFPPLRIYLSSHFALYFIFVPSFIYLSIIILIVDRVYLFFYLITFVRWLFLVALYKLLFIYCKPASTATCQS